MQKTMRNRRVIGGLLFLAVLVGAALLAGPTQAATSNGPYYAEPAWDQKLAPATRFIVLADWDSQAVLDRETGLVWEQEPQTTPESWFFARRICADKTIGGRKGWRLPSVHELASLIDPTLRTSPALPLGHPLTIVWLGRYWSATTLADNPLFAWVVFLDNGFVDHSAKTGTDLPRVWCVRGGTNAHGY